MSIPTHSNQYEASKYLDGCLSTAILYLNAPIPIYGAEFIEMIGPRIQYKMRHFRIKNAWYY